MAAVKKLAREFKLSRDKDLLWGRVNDVFINIRFIRHIRNESNANIIEALIQPKYERVSMDFYVNKKSGINLAEVNEHLEKHHAIFKTNQAIYNKGRFWLSLFPRNTIGIKVGYTASFIDDFTDYLTFTEYGSGCEKCGGSDNLSQVYTAGKATEICESCRLMETKL